MKNGFPKHYQYEKVDINNLTLGYNRIFDGEEKVLRNDILVTFYLIVWVFFFISLHVSINSEFEYRSLFRQIRSRFGSALTLLDVNLDGMVDLVVGASSYGNTNYLDYNVRTCTKENKQRKTNKNKNRRKIMIFIHPFMCSLFSK